MAPAAYAGHNVANPHPYLLDEWRYEVFDDSGWAYSHYFMKAPGLGSTSAVKDIWGKTHSYDKRDIGWAESGATKQAWWVRADAFYGWYDL